MLVDEINRATPRTQSALLEAMAEGQVTVDNVRRDLSPTFFVLATQNPVEHHGTYPLPEAQLDRFAMKLSIGYPGRPDELAMLRGAVGAGDASLKEDDAPLTPESLHALRREVAALEVLPAVQEYLLDLARATREHPLIHLGVSPRGLLTWQRVAQAHAYLKGRSFVTPSDIQEIAGPVLAVRLAGEFPGIDALTGELFARVPVPVGI